MVRAASDLSWSATLTMPASLPSMLINICQQHVQNQDARLRCSQLMILLAAGAQIIAVTCKPRSNSNQPHPSQHSKQSLTCMLLDACDVEASKNLSAADCSLVERPSRTHSSLPTATSRPSILPQMPLPGICRQVPTSTNRRSQPGRSIQESGQGSASSALPGHAQSPDLFCALAIYFSYCGFAMLYA